MACRGLLTFSALAAFGALAAVGVLIWQFGWWAIAGLAGAGLAALLVVALAFRGLLFLPFRARGAALRGAEMEVHAVRRLGAAPAPVRPDHPAAGRSVEVVEIDLTITPRSTHGGPSPLWSPLELRLVRPGAPRLPGRESPVDRIGVVQGAIEWRDGVWILEEVRQVEGARRLQLTLHLHRTVDRFELRYFLEGLGVIELAPAPDRPARD